MHNTLIILVGPSGAGKTTIARKMLESDITDMILKSVTDRPIGKNESTDEYTFMAKGTINLDDLAEYADYDGNTYGMPKSELDKAFALDRSVVVTEINGARQLKKYCEGKCKVITVFIDTPSDELRGRLEARGRGRVEERMQRVIKDRLAIVECDLYMVNSNGSMNNVLNNLNFIYSLAGA